VVSELESQLKECHGHLEVAMQRIKTLQDQQANTSQYLTTIACVYEQESIRAEDYSSELLAEYILDKARATQARMEQLSRELVALEQEKIFYYEKKVEELDCEVQNRRRLENFYREVTVGFMPKFKALLDPRLIQDMGHETEEA